MECIDWALYQNVLSRITCLNMMVYWFFQLFRKYCDWFLRKTCCCLHADKWHRHVVGITFQIDNKRGNCLSRYGAVVSWCINVLIWHKLFLSFLLLVQEHIHLLTTYLQKLHTELCLFNFSKFHRSCVVIIYFSLILEKQNVRKQNIMYKLVLNWT